MSLDVIDTPVGEDFDIFAEDATRIFVPGAVIGDDDEFGTLIAATVVPRYVPHLGVSKVTIRILPIQKQYAAALREVTSRFSASVQTPVILRYIGVWHVSGETWLVSECRRQVPLHSLFLNVHSADIESIISHIAQRALQALQTMHDDHGLAHLYVRPMTIHLCDDGTLVLSDPAIYHLLCDSLSSRRSFPGKKVWPVPASRESDALHRADVWDLGITLLTLVDGGAAVARMWRSGRRIPRLASPSRWSAQFNSFLSHIFTQGGKLATASELLSHRFITDASETACVAAVGEYFASSEDAIAHPYANDMISSLFKQNSAVVRAPLISIDEISTDHFDYEKWKGTDQNRPTVELSLVRMLKTCREKPLTRDAEENKSLSHTTAKLETFLETADMM